MGRWGNWLGSDRLLVLSVDKACRGNGSEAAGGRGVCCWRHQLRRSTRMRLKLAWSTESSDRPGASWADGLEERACAVLRSRGARCLPRLFHRRTCGGR